MFGRLKSESCCLVRKVARGLRVSPTMPMATAHSLETLNPTSLSSSPSSLWVIPAEFVFSWTTRSANVARMHFVRLMKSGFYVSTESGYKVIGRSPSKRRPRVSSPQPLRPVCDAQLTDHPPQQLDLGQTSSPSVNPPAAQFLREGGAHLSLPFRSAAPDVHMRAGMLTKTTW